MNYINNNIKDPYFNMAFDEFCLENLKGETPFFCLWQNEPSVILGLNQNALKEVNMEYLKEKNIHLVRRITGGGAVYHDEGNLNFTFIDDYKNEINQFKKFAQFIVDALSHLGLNGVKQNGRNDISLNDKKISGCAKRVKDNRIMIHGTLLYNVDLIRLFKALNGPQSKIKSKGVDSLKSTVTNIKPFLPELKDIKDLKTKLNEYLYHGGGHQIELTTGMCAQIKEEAINKFSTPSWILGKSSDYKICNETKLKCGKVKIELAIEKENIDKIKFSGDFIGSKDVQELEDKLLNQQYNYNSIVHYLNNITISDFFDGITDLEFLNLIFPNH